MEPLAFVDRVEVTDPEGTAFGYDVDEDGAKNWAAGVYQQGHLLHVPGAGDRPLPLFGDRISRDGQHLHSAGAAGGHGRHRLDHQATPRPIRASRSR